jgi:hypothetical protein
VAKPDLAIILGPKPKGGEMRGREEDDSGGYGDIPPDFADHCDAAFDAIKKGDREKFCNELWLAFKAYEEQPHEEAEEPGETEEEIPEEE